MKFFTFLNVVPALLASVFLSAPAQGAIISSTPQLLDDNIASNSTFQPNSFTISQSNLVLLVGLGWDSSGTPSQVRYGGVDADGIINDGRRGTLAYFLNPAVGTADITATYSESSFAGALGYAWTLSGVDLNDPIADTATGSDGSLTINVTNPDSYIADFLYLNTGSSPPDADSALTTLAQATSGAGPASYSLSVSAGEVNPAQPGTINLGWASTNADYSEIAIAFNMIPEPSSAILFAGLVFGLLVLRRRRQASGCV